HDSVQGGIRRLLDGLTICWTDPATTVEQKRARCEQIVEEIGTAYQTMERMKEKIVHDSTAGQLILPEALKLLSIYVTALIKCDPLIGTQTRTTDDRS
ncbi:unnamed protein product, partial [Didymodactylos carnosus]